MILRKQRWLASKKYGITSLHPFQFEAAENAFWSQLFRDPTHMEREVAMLPTGSTADKTTSARIHSYR